MTVPWDQPGADPLGDFLADLDAMARRAAWERASRIEDQLREAWWLQDPRMRGRLHKVSEPGDDLLRVASSTDLGWYGR